ncbi:MAG: ATP-binding protein [Coriobacteriales bacterium]|nr:ATP-binding protein [Coriobacteriales bacterium]
MDYLEHVINVMIYAGSLLMVYNIGCCYGFVRRMKVEETSRARYVLLHVPLALLVSFLVGYLVVGIFGDPDVIVAGILFGGSVFVFLVLGIMYDIIDRLRDAKAQSQVLYEDVRGDLSKLTEEYVTVIKVNLTHNKIEELDGNQLYESDPKAQTFSEFAEGRRAHLLSEPTMVGGSVLLSREGLLACYQQGRKQVEETLLCRSANGNPVFVRVEITLSVQLATNDVVALITERQCTNDLVDEVILTKALAGQFDMITCLIDGHYEVIIGENSEARRGSIFPKHRRGAYADYLAEQVAPVIMGTNEQRRELMEALSPERVDLELARREPYEVNISCNVGGEVFYKRFVFYVIDAATKFYLLLKSDTTTARIEEIERNERLREALEEAQRASQAKTTFLSNMSHDIRTPMNAIVGYTEFAKRAETMDDMRLYLQKIDASSAYLLALINDVLEMSRIESGKLELEMEDVDLCEVMRDLKGMFETQMAEKGVAFDVRGKDMRNCLVRCDATRFNRVLLNLLSNAYKFTPEGGSVTVTFTQLEEAPDGFASYQISVKDAGIGMSPEFAAKVFDEFERERNTTASGIQGTGLGMAITKRIVDMMGGSIDVISEPGKGTEFVVRVKMETREETPEEQAVGVVQDEEEFDDFEGMRVLLAEDNEINREIACMLLEELGFVLDAVTNGQEAVDKLVEVGPGHYDLVITDIQMPVMNGYDEARAIRALDDPALAGIPIVAMSANAFKEDVDAAMAVGMNGYVSKPIDMGEVIDELTRVMREVR